MLQSGNELRSALAIAAVALGIDFVSGRASAAFYAQTGRAGWLGIGVSTLLFGLAIAWISEAARRTGARRLGALLDRLPGGGAGRGARILYALILPVAVIMLTTSAGHMSALMLPMQRADLPGGALALATALAIALVGRKALRWLGGILVVLMLILELALFFCARLPETMRYEIELRLRENWVAAIFFALLHTSACLCLCAGMTVRLSGGRTNSMRLGGFSGAFYGLLLGVGNAAIMAKDERILALKLPFTALCAGWGTTGFYINAALSWLFSMFSLSGLIYGILPSGRGSKYPKMRC